MSARDELRSFKARARAAPETQQAAFASPEFKQLVAAARVEEIRAGALQAVPEAHCIGHCTSHCISHCISHPKELLSKTLSAFGK